MGQNQNSKPGQKAAPASVYGDEINDFIEECRSCEALARQNDLLSRQAALSPAKKSSRNAASKSKLAQKEEELRKLDAELTRREIELLQKELKFLSQQQELDKLRPLSGLYRVIQAMATQQGLDSLLDVIARETRTMLQCDRSSVFVVDPHNSQLWTRAAIGTEDDLLHVALSGTSIVSLAARTQQAVNIADAYADSRFDPSIDEADNYHTRNILCVPMINRQSEVIGVFEVVNKIDGAFTQADLEWLQGLTAVAAGLIEQARSYQEIERFVQKTLETLAQTIDKRDPLTAGHSMRVTKYSVLMGEALDLPENDLDILRYAAMMHDYGKIGVPEAILWKNGRLTPEEYKVVQTHANITYELLSNLPFTQRLSSVPFVASCHHEKLDGSGYYRGLKGREIPFLARIIAVADVFDALTSVRHYRNRMDISKVSEIMTSGRDNHFDSNVVAALYSLPCDQVLKVMESERGQDIPAELNLFGDISFGRLLDLCNGVKPRAHEKDLVHLFTRIYSSGLPGDYQALD